MRRRSVDSTSACLKAGSGSVLGSAPQGGFPTELISDEEMERNFGEWHGMNVLYECDGMNVLWRVVLLLYVYTCRSLNS